MEKTIKEHLKYCSEVIIAVNEPEKEGKKLQQWFFNHGINWGPEHLRDKIRFENVINYYHIRYEFGHYIILYNDKRHIIKQKDSVVYNVKDILCDPEVDIIMNGLINEI